MKLSIIVPVYNMAGEGKLEYCLNSLINQTISDYEIIAVNDASTDHSYDILLRYQEQYPDKVIALSLPENHKQGGAKNAGLDVCRGEYIGFVDSDDWVLPDMYERLLQAAEEQNADVAACDLAYAYEHTMTIGERIPGLRMQDTGEMTDDKFRGLLSDSGAIVTKIYRRHIFEEPRLRFPEHMFYEDNAIGTEILHRANKIAYLPEPMYFYYQHAASTVHTVSEEKCENRMEAMRIMIRMAKESGYYETFYPELEYKFAHLFYHITLFSYMHGTQRKRFGFMRKLAKETREFFPDFQKNAMFREKINPEELRMMAVQQKSTFLFYCYFEGLRNYRELRKKLKR